MIDIHCLDFTLFEVLRKNSCSFQHFQIYLKQNLKDMHVCSQIEDII